MKPLTIYISGPITGMSNNNHKAFEFAERIVKERGHIAYNPLKFEEHYTRPNDSWEGFMKRDIPYLMKADIMVTLPGHELSRAVEQRGGDKKPQLSDLRESGAIEQDADNVIFIYRPEYYDIELLEDGTITKGLVELIVAKARDGEIGSIRAHFDGATSTMCDFEDTFDVPIGIEDTPKFKAKLLDEDDVPF